MRYYVTVGKGEDALRREVRFEESSDGKVVAYVSGLEGEDHYRASYEIDGHALAGDSALHLIVGDDSHDFAIEKGLEGRELVWRGERLPIEVIDERELLARQVSGTPEGKQELRASMPGIVVSVEVEVGEEVAEGATLVVIEAMKMQNPIVAEAAATVRAIHIEPGQAVAAGEPLLSLE